MTEGLKVLKLSEHQMSLAEWMHNNTTNHYKLELNTCLNNLKFCCQFVFVTVLPHHMQSMFSVCCTCYFFNPYYPSVSVRSPSNGQFGALMFKHLNTVSLNHN